jgi:hypothetical protein
MAAAFDRDQLLDAFDEIGRGAITAETRLDIAVFGGSALMLAGNFRFDTEDVDIAEIGDPWPDWLTKVVAELADRNKWSANWLNSAVGPMLSQSADPKKDLLPFGTFPRGARETGLSVFVPTARYMLALKLMALRVSDYSKGSKDIADVASLLKVLQIDAVEPAIDVLAEYFPKRANDADKQRFVLKHILAMQRTDNAPEYPRGSR